MKCYPSELQLAKEAFLKLENAPQDDEGDLVLQAGWAGIEGDEVWHGILLEEAARLGVDGTKIQVAYEAGQAGDLIP